MVRPRVLLPLLVCLVLGVTASPVLAAQKFRPRVGNALGLIPPVNSHGNFNTEPPEFGVFNAVTYHGGPTMTAGGAVHVHVIFWQAPGFAFQGSPGSRYPRLRVVNRAVLHRRPS